MFELVPSTPLDNYYNRQQAGIIKAAIVSTNDDRIEQEIQTEDLGNVDKFNQAPEDFVENYSTETETYQRKKKRNNDANLAKFMQTAGPLM